MTLFDLMCTLSCFTNDVMEKCLSMSACGSLIFCYSIADLMRNSGCEVPEWMLKMKRPSK